MAVAPACPLVIVNAVVYLLAVFAVGQSDTALAAVAIGGGSMLVAIVRPRLLDTISDRTVMLAVRIDPCSRQAGRTLISSFRWLLPLWFIIGAAVPTAPTPSERLLALITHGNPPALFATPARPLAFSREREIEGRFTSVLGDVETAEIDVGTLSSIQQGGLVTFGNDRHPAEAELTGCNLILEARSRTVSIRPQSCLGKCANQSLPRDPR